MTSSAERRVAVVLLLLATALVVALHALDRSFDPGRRFMSEYALGAWGALMRAVFFLLAASGALLARALVAARNRFVVLGLVAWSIGMTTSGLFLTDSSLPGAVHTWMGVLHDGGADLAFGAILIAVLASSPRGWILAVAMFATVIAGRLADLPGLGQRAFAMLAIGWQLVLALGRPRRVP